MSIELVGFENLPNAYIKEVAIFDYSRTQIEVRTTICVHDLKDGSVWSDTSEFLAQFIKMSVFYSTDSDQSDRINSGELDITTLDNIHSKSIKSPKVVEDNLVYEYTFPFIINKNPSHLTVYAFCYISQNQILENLGIQVSKSYLGPVKAEKIFEGFSLFDNTFVFLRDNGEYWSGPVHQHINGKYMIGSYHKDTPHEKLRRIIIKNTKLKDMRVSTRSVVKKSTEVANYISDLEVSYNSNTDVNSLFMLNIKSLLKQKTKYGSFLERASDFIVSQIIQNFTIKLMTIERLRIKANRQSNYLRTSKLKAQKIFSKKIISKTHDVNGVIKNSTRLERKGIYDVVESELRSYSEEKNRKKSEIFIEQIGEYKKISKITEMFFDYGEEIRTFQLNDYELTDNMPGDYQYLVNLSFIDPIDTFLRQTMRIMSQDMSQIKTYVGQVSRGRDMLQTSVNYQALVESYVSNYSYVYNISDKEKNQMISKYLNILSPMSVTLETAKKFEKDYKDLQTMFISFLDYDPEIALRRNKPVSIKSKDPTTARVSISNTFDKIVTPSFNKFGFGYFNDTKKDSMKIFSKRQYVERTQEDTEANYVSEPNFNSPDLPDGVNKAIRDTTSFSTAFLAPKFGKNGNSRYNMGLGERAPISDISELYTKAEEKNNNDITVRAPSVSIQETSEGEELFVEASKIIGSNHEFVNYDELKDSYSVSDVQTSVQSKIQNSLSGFNYGRTFDVILQNTKKLSPEQATALPNQLKAVIGGTTNSTRNNYVSEQNDLLANPNTKNYYEVNNFSVQQIVYVDGFMRDKNNNILLNKPAYKLMSLENFSVLEKPVLCFLQAYTNNVFNIENQNKASVLDSVFILSDRDLSIVPNRESNQQQSNYNIQDLSYITMNSQIVVQTNQAVTVNISQTNQAVTVNISQTNENIEVTSDASLMNVSANLFGSY